MLLGRAVGKNSTVLKQCERYDPIFDHWNYIYDGGMTMLQHCSIWEPPFCHWGQWKKKILATIEKYDVYNDR